MNKRAISVVCTVGIILALCCVIYIFLNFEEDEPKVEENVDTTEQEVVSRQERSQNIILTSRVGTKITELVRYPNKYSLKLTEELDENGVSNKYKILVAFNKILSKEEYQNLVGYSETYANTYVLSSNMQIAITDLFEDDSLTNETVEGVLYYDAPTDSYAMITTGVQGYVEDFVVEVPYEITEYTDRYELLEYRLYVSQSVQNIEGEDTIVTDIYYDSDKTKNAISFSDNSVFYESNQVEYLQTKIADGSISESKLDSVKYILVEDNGTYKLSGYEKIEK